MCQELLEGVLAVDDRSNAYNPQRWRRLADLCIQQGKITAAQRCAQRANDLSLSLLLLSCTGDRAGLYELSKQAKEEEQLNIAFLALYLAGDASACLQLLQDCGKLPEAAFFSLSHLPSHVTAAFEAWREDLRARKHIAAELLASPQEYASYFPGLDNALQLEQALEPLRQTAIAASEYLNYRAMVEGEGLDLSQLRQVGEVYEEEQEQEQEDVREEKEEQEVEEVEENMEMNGEEQEEQEIDSEFAELEGEIEDDGEDLDLDGLEEEWN